MQTYLVTQPGLEATTAAELRGLGLKVPRIGRGGLAVRMATTELYAANLHLRTASRVLLRVGEGHVENFAQLATLVEGVPWARWLRPDVGSSTVKVACTRSRLNHTGAVEERVLEQLGSLGGGTIHVRIADNIATLSIDSSGEHLHRRGWRLETAKAPLRETLAAAVLLTSGWCGETPLHDPMCGSGTIVIEAALLAAGLAPGRNRSFAFEQWPEFRPDAWAAVRSRMPDPRPVSVSIVGTDRDAGAIDAARANAKRAGVADLVRFDVSAIGAVRPAEGALIVTNPPYGNRVQGGDPRNLFAALGQIAGSCPVAVIAPDRNLVGRIRPGIIERFATSNGGIPVKVFTG